MEVTGRERNDISVAGKGAGDWTGICNQFEPAFTGNTNSSFCGRVEGRVR